MELGYLGIGDEAVGHPLLTDLKATLALHIWDGLTLTPSVPVKSSIPWDCMYVCMPDHFAFCILHFAMKHVKYEAFTE